MTGTILYEVSGGIARLVLNHPGKLNALSLPMWRAIPHIVADAIADRSVRLIVLAGAGERAFSAGADISRFGEERQGADAVKAYDTAVEAAELALVNAAKPTVALIKGICFGGGLGLASSCDLRLADASARFCIPAAKLGIGYSPRGIARLARLVGPSHVAEIFFTARRYDAAEAHHTGLVTRLYDDDVFARETEKYLAGIAANAPLSLQAAKLALRELDRPESARSFAAAAAMVAACYTSDDYGEGQNAFAERRAPVFSGR